MLAYSISQAHINICVFRRNVTGRS